MVDAALALVLTYALGLGCDQNLRRGEPWVGRGGVLSAATTNDPDAAKLVTLPMTHHGTWQSVASSAGMKDVFHILLHRSAPSV